MCADASRPVLVEDFDDSFTKWEDEWFLGGWPLLGLVKGGEWKLGGVEVGKTPPFFLGNGSVR